MDKQALLEKVAKAKQDLGEAEADLEQVLASLKVSARAEKATIGKALEDAFSKLKHASRHLLEMEKLIETEKG